MRNTLETTRSATGKQLCVSTETPIERHFRPQNCLFPLSRRSVECVAETDGHWRMSSNLVMLSTAT